MGQNLTGQLISATYEDLVQISGSILTDGTGSDITNLTVTSSFATYANNAGVASLANNATSASHAVNSDSAISASYALTASFALNGGGGTVDTGSLMVTGSATNNVLTFTKGDGSTFNLTVDTGSAVSVNTGSLLVTASISDATITFTKGDASTFNITVNNVVNADSASVATSSSYALTASFAQNVSTPTLQQVTSQGATTTDTITINTASPGTTSLLTTAAIKVSASEWPNVEIQSTGIYDPTVNFQKGTTYYASVAADANNLSIQSLNGADIRLNSNGGEVTVTGSLSVSNVITGSITNAISASHAIFADTASFLPATTNLNVASISASNATFQSASIGFLQTVTGSATIIGDAYIILNTSDATRYAGIAVEDSGSGTPNNYTASFNFDSQTNDWFYEYTSSGDPDNFGVAMFGPEYNTKGSPIYLTNNRIPKGDGGHHLNDSNISDNGTLVSINSNAEVKGNLTVTGSSNTVVAVEADTQPSLQLNISDNSYDVELFNSYGNVGLISNQNDPGLANKAATTYPIYYYAGLNNADNAYTNLQVNGVDIIKLVKAGAQVTGSLNVSGGITGSLEGTASFATTTATASYVLNAVSSSYSAFALSASYSDTSISASHALNANNTITASFYSLANVTQNAVFSGSVRGDVSDLPIVSNTASLDLSTGNFFTISLVSGSNTHISPSNIQPGQTINLLVNTTGSGLVSFPSSVKQVSGSSYTPTTGSGTLGKDIITFISFDNTSLYLSNVKNLV